VTVSGWQGCLVTGAGRGNRPGRSRSGSSALEPASRSSRAPEDELNQVARAAKRARRSGAGRDSRRGRPGSGRGCRQPVQRELGTVEVLVNNAAVVWPLGPTSLIDPADWAAAMAINVIGPVTLTRALLPGMLERGWGRIVNVSSGIAAYPAAMIGGNAYAATKAALEAHTLNLAAELAGSGVTVNASAPERSTPPCRPGSASQPPEKSAPRCTRASRERSNRAR